MDQNFMLTQLTAGGIAVWLMQKLKASSLMPWITQHTDNLNRVLALVLATATAAGLGYGYAWEAGTFTLQISGITVASVGTFLWKVLSGVVTQEIIYRAAVKPFDSPVVTPKADPDGEPEGAQPPWQYPKV